jgi:hypothetical protein
MPSDQAGARFFDLDKRDRGWASKVVRRERSLDRLVVLDVTSTAPAPPKHVAARSATASTVDSQTLARSNVVLSGGLARSRRHGGFGAVARAEAPQSPLRG